MVSGRGDVHGRYRLLGPPARVVLPQYVPPLGLPQLPLGVHHQGLLGPGLGGEQVQEAQEPCDPGARCAHDGRPAEGRRHQQLNRLITQVVGQQVGAHPALSQARSGRKGWVGAAHRRHQPVVPVAHQRAALQQCYRCRGGRGSARWGASSGGGGCRLVRCRCPLHHDLVAAAVECEAEGKALQQHVQGRLTGTGVRPWQARLQGRCQLQAQCRLGLGKRLGMVRPLA
mmetsp:Transcript_4146/g.9041  ORF Transcript_4146/g.9041 Transcript_4146/m.9041 type:complete len:228 (+) Transcript_4146:48-731(+)